MNTVADLGKAVKAKYPGVYDDLNDAVLGSLMKQKFPGAYNDFAEMPDISTGGTASGMRGPLTAKEQTVNALRSAAQMIPEATGATLGGLTGAAMGAPAGPTGAFAGATAGAGTGAALGKGFEVMFLRKMFPSIFRQENGLPGDAPNSVDQKLAEISRAGNMGMMAEAGGRGIAQVLPKAFSRYIKPQVQKDINVLESEGIPYTAGDIRPGGGAQILENLTRGTLLGGKVMSDFDVTQAAKLYSFKQRFLNDIGPLFSKQETGQLIQKSVETRAKDLFSKGGVFDKAYTKIATLYPATVDTAKIRGQIQPLLQDAVKLVEKGRIPTASSPESPSKFISLLKDLSVYGTRQTPAKMNGLQGMTPGKTVDVPITYADIWKDKQTIQGILRSMGDDSLRTRAKATLQQVESILDDAMEEAASKVSPQASKYVRKVNNAYKQAKGLMETESLVAEMRNGRYDPEKIVTRFFEGDNVTPTTDLMRAIPAKEKAKVLPVVRRRTLENLFSKSTTPLLEEGIDTTSGKRLLTEVNKNKEALKKLLTTDQMTALDDFINASQRAQKSGVMTNPMSGRQMLALSQAGAALQFGTTGLALALGKGSPAGFVTAGTTILGPRFLAHAMVNPKIAKFIAKGFTMSAATAEKTGWTTRVANMVRMYEEANGEEKPE